MQRFDYIEDDGTYHIVDYKQGTTSRASSYVTIAEVYDVMLAIFMVEKLNETPKFYKTNR